MIKMRIIMNQNTLIYLQNQIHDFLNCSSLLVLFLLMLVIIFIIHEEFLSGPNTCEHTHPKHFTPQKPLDEMKHYKIFD